VRVRRDHRDRLRRARGLLLDQLVEEGVAPGERCRAVVPFAELLPLGGAEERQHPHRSPPPGVVRRVRLVRRRRHRLDQRREPAEQARPGRRIEQIGVPHQAHREPAARAGLRRVEREIERCRPPRQRHRLEPQAAQVERRAARGERQRA